MNMTALLKKKKANTREPHTLSGIPSPETIIIYFAYIFLFFLNSVLTTFSSRMHCHADKVHVICDPKVPSMQY